MTFTLDKRQEKNLKRILAWLIHNRTIDPMTQDEARELYAAISNVSHKAEG
jgi:5-methylcytosine-specific restriction endonuclease McrBC regulatory subunit McrC